MDKEAGDEHYYLGTCDCCGGDRPHLFLGLCRNWKPSPLHAPTVPPQAEPPCWHKEINDEGICQACGAKAAIKIEGLQPHQPEPVGVLRGVQDSTQKAKEVAADRAREAAEPPILDGEQPHPFPPGPELDAARAIVAAIGESLAFTIDYTSDDWRNKIAAIIRSHRGGAGGGESDGNLDIRNSVAPVRNSDTATQAAQVAAPMTAEDCSKAVFRAQFHCSTQASAIKRGVPVIEAYAAHLTAENAGLREQLACVQASAKHSLRGWQEAEQRIAELERQVSTDSKLLGEMADDLTAQVTKDGRWAVSAAGGETSATPPISQRIAELERSLRWLLDSIPHHEGDDNLTEPVALARKVLDSELRGPAGEGHAAPRNSHAVMCNSQIVRGDGARGECNCLAGEGK